MACVFAEICGDTGVDKEDANEVNEGEAVLLRGGVKSLSEIGCEGREV